MSAIGDHYETARWQQRRREILGVAASLLEQHGSSVSMGMVARESGIAKPSLYHYIASKDDMLFAIHDEFIELILQAQRVRREEGSPPIEQVKAALFDILAVVHTHRAHVRSFFLHLSELSEESRAKIEAKRDEYAANLTEAISAAMIDGDLRRMPARLACFALLGMANWSYQWYQPDGSMTPDVIGDYFWELYLRGLGSDT